MQEPKLGDRVRASMDGENWFTGKYVKESDTFAQYGVLRDDIGEVRFFINAVAHNHCCCDACKDGTLHSSDCAVHNMPAYQNGPCDCEARHNAELCGGTSATNAQLCVTKEQ